MREKQKVNFKKAQKEKKVDFKALIRKMELLNQRVCFICPIKTANPETSHRKACLNCQVKALIRDVLRTLKDA